jgi:hypothetical protein
LIVPLSVASPSIETIEQAADDAFERGSQVLRVVSPRRPTLARCVGSVGVRSPAR